MASTPLRKGDKLVIKHTSRTARALVKDITYRIDVNTLHRNEDVAELGLNDVARVALRATMPLFFDEYRRNRITGSFILVSESTQATVGAGMLLR